MIGPLAPGGTGLQQRVHPAGDEPFQTPADLAATVAVSSPFGDVGAGLGAWAIRVMTMAATNKIDCISRLTVIFKGTGASPGQLRLSRPARQRGTYTATANI